MKKSVLNREFTGVLKTSLPLVVVELVSSLYSLTDTYFVSGLGEEAVAAVGISMYLLMFIQAFTALFTTPAIVYTSQGVGAGRYIEARRATGEALFYGLLFILGLSILFYYYSPLLVIVQSGVRGITFEYAVAYLGVRVLGFPVLLSTMFMDSMIIASGRTVYSMIANTIGLLLNIVLDPLLIYGLFGLPKLGVVGAALATVVSNATTFPIQLYYLSKIGLVPLLSPRNGYLKKTLELGLPALSERLVFSLGNNVYAGVVARLGSTVMAAHNIGLRIESLIYMPGFAFSMTAASMVGRKIGSGSIEDAKKTGLNIILLGTLVMTILGFIIGVAGYYIAAPFSPNEEVRKLASIYLLYAGFSELGLGLAMITSGALRGGGNTRIPMIVNIASLILVRITLSLLLAPSIGPHGPWLAMFLDVYTRGFALITIYKFYFEKLLVELSRLFLIILQ